MENWKDIIGYEGLYQISDHGNVKSSFPNNRRHIAGVKKPGIASQSGYYQVQLTDRAKNKKCFYVHRLVAIHFIPNIEGKPKINHKDSNKLNNHFSNLEWCTQLENVRHAHANGHGPNYSTRRKAA